MERKNNELIRKYEGFIQSLDSEKEKNTELNENMKYLTKKMMKLKKLDFQE